MPLRRSTHPSTAALLALLEPDKLPKTPAWTMWNEDKAPCL